MEKLKIAVVGLGNRGQLFAEYVLDSADAELTAIADCNESAREKAQNEYKLAPQNCYESADEFFAQGKCADAVFICTQDSDHKAHTIKAMQLGYDVCLEKPIATKMQDCEDIYAAQQATGRKVMICHVLRYSHFYGKLRQMIKSGEIGDVVTISQTENVGYWHDAHSYVRGVWSNAEKSSPMILAKCCHDLDLITWFKSGVAPVRVSSFGGLHYFTREHAPANSGEHCLLDCPVEEACPYSVRKLYLNHPDRWVFYVWPELEESGDLSIEAKTARLKDPSNPYSRCIWKMDNDVADRQVVAIEFADGSVATHNLVGGTSRPMRKIHLLGTTGELEGVFDDNRFVIRHSDTRPGHEYSETVVDLNNLGDTTGAYGSHGGGDERLTADFVAILNGREKSVSCTELADSINGHRIGFAADRARIEHTVVEL